MLAVENKTKVNDLNNNFFENFFDIDYNDRFRNENDCIDNHMSNTNVSVECAESTDTDINNADRKGVTAYNNADLLDFLHLHPQLLEIQYFQPTHFIRAAMRGISIGGTSALQTQMGENYLLTLFQQYYNNM